MNSHAAAIAAISAIAAIAADAGISANARSCSAAAGGSELSRAPALAVDGQGIGVFHLYAALNRQFCVVHEDQMNAAGDCDTGGNGHAGVDHVPGVSAAAPACAGFRYHFGRCCGARL